MSNKLALISFLVLGLSVQAQPPTGELAPGVLRTALVPFRAIIEKSGQFVQTLQENVEDIKNEVLKLPPVSREIFILGMLTAGYIFIGEFYRSLRDTHYGLAALVALPALTAGTGLYGALRGIWELGAGEKEAERVIQESSPRV
jgi:hypothetical protein